MAQRLYECMFLLDSSRYAQDPQGTEKIVHEFLERCEAEVVGQAPWQDGKLAYEIDGHRKGLHYLVYFKMDGSKVEALNRMCKLSDVVIRQLLLEHEEKLFDLMTGQVAEGVGPSSSDDDNDSDEDSADVDAEDVVTAE